MNLELLDWLTIFSFVLQLQNQSNIVGISDVQGEVNRAVAEIHAHLEEQDRKINIIMKEVTKNGTDQEAFKHD